MEFLLQNIYVNIVLRQSIGIFLTCIILVVHIKIYIYTRSTNSSFFVELSIKLHCKKFALKYHSDINSIMAQLVDIFQLSMQTKKLKII